jgi:predicted TIM-barrel fold metal-dependent hydrolase
VIDCCVRALPATDHEILEFIDPPFRETAPGHVFGYRYVPAINDLHPDAGADIDDPRATDPDAVGAELFGRRGVDRAILVTPNRLLRSDWRQDDAMARATNEWLASTWLAGKYGDRFFGSIQVPPNNARAAVREIERWADHPQFVQVSVPTHVHAPYGEERYFEIWEAAADRGLPVAFHGDGNGGVEFPPSMAGFPSHFIEVHSLLAMGGIVHVVSLLSEGVFDRLPGLVVVLTDGGFSVAPPLLWREDVKARALKDEMPWVSLRPSEYLGDHVRFLGRRDDFPDEPERLEAALELSAADRTLMYSSNFPMWDALGVDGEYARIPQPLRDGVLSGNALATYPKLRAAVV